MPAADFDRTGEACDPFGVPVPFARTLGALQGDRSRGVLVALVLLVLATFAALAWSVWGELPVTAASSEARLETAELVHVVNAPIAGRLSNIEVHLGDQVHAGQVLARLDDQAARLALEVARAKLAGLDERLPSLREQLASEERALGQTQQVSGLAQGELAAQARAAVERERLAASEARRTHDLTAGGITSKAELERADSAARTTAADLHAVELEQARARAERELDETAAKRRVEDITQTLTEVEGQRTVASAEIARLEHEVERCQVLAPVSGRIGASRELTAGTFVDEGTELMRIVPGATLRAVALFSPASALGRIRAGQRARMRLDGFPALQYGLLDARVVRLSSEAVGGQVRVELELHPSAELAPHLEHGLTGVVEVEVERLPPYALVLRAAGRWFEAPSAPAEPAAP
jgi:membrane fusion protein (multidrug efflux system)